MSNVTSLARRRSPTPTSSSSSWSRRRRPSHHPDSLAGSADRLPAESIRRHRHRSDAGAGRGPRRLAQLKAGERRL